MSGKEDQKADAGADYSMDHHSGQPADADMVIRRTEEKDLPEVLAIYEHARSFMRENGNPRQWGDRWPPEELIRKDISLGKSYVCEKKGEILATFFYNAGKKVEPTYSVIDGKFTGSDEYGVVHRIAVSGNGHGVGSFCIDWAYLRCGRNLRMDTHPDNKVMQHTLLKNGFRYCGIIHVEEDDDPRYAYEKYPERCGEEYYLKNVLLTRYHDEEWGKPEHDEQRLYEMFVLELFQAGVSWELLLRKRENFRRDFDGFDPVKIAAYGPEKVGELMQDPGIIRNRRKIEAAIGNAKVVLKLREEFGSFSEYLWHFTGGKSILEGMSVTRNQLSDDVAKDMKKRGIRFAGSVTVFSFLQAVGIIYSHEPKCFCYERDGAESFRDNRYPSI